MSKHLNIFRLLLNLNETRPIFQIKQDHADKGNIPKLPPIAIAKELSQLESNLYESLNVSKGPCEDEKICKTEDGKHKCSYPDSKYNL